jgi:predicted molibdopterin-dependent oxidoreductase YjgC
MVKLKIDNIEYEVTEGASLLDAAKAADIHIPTLCHNDKLLHFSSCMVCMVREKRTGNFLPSCSASVQEGMDIDCSSDDVISIRKRAVELLLSEHRAECEAPCRVVCPGGYNVPLMNRYIQSSDFMSAVQLFVSQTGASELKCITCQAYCENACRRKKVDIPVSIRNLQIFIAELIKKEESAQALAADSPETAKAKRSGRFESRIGRMLEDELKEWLKECRDDLKRHREISDPESAAMESLSCMHCDCRAADDCRLRDLADALSLKDPKGKLINSPIRKKININTGLIFENAKCIKCGLCVRLCETYKDGPALCFINRGFVSIISEPLTEEFNDILKTKSKEVVEVCPTGALSLGAPCHAARDIPLKGE